MLRWIFIHLILKAFFLERITCATFDLMSRVSATPAARPAVPAARRAPPPTATAAARRRHLRLAAWLCCAAVAAALPAAATARAAPNPRPALMSHHLTKRSFFDIQCKGVYDKSIFAKLDRICEDCYNLFREPTIHSLCRKNCFTTDYFKGCLDTLQMSSEMEQVQIWIKQLHGAEPGV